MDDKQFAVEFAKALAWPLVALVFLIIARHHIGEMIKRIAKFTYPGGAIEFNKAMESAQKKQEKLDGGERPIQPIKLPGPRASCTELSPADQATLLAASPGIDRFFTLASISPEAAIDDTYRVIEGIPDAYKTKIPVENRRNLYTLISYLNEQHLIGHEWVELFAQIVLLRKLAVGGKSKGELTFNDAMNYQSLCRSLSDELQKVLNGLKNLE